MKWKTKIPHCQNWKKKIKSSIYDIWCAIYFTWLYDGSTAVCCKPEM